MTAAADAGEVERAAAHRLDALITEHRHAVLAHAERLTGGDRAWAEDVTQETFLRAWLHWDRMTPEFGSIRGWLLRVAHNVVIDGYRTSRMRFCEIGIDDLVETAVPGLPTPDWTEQVLLAQMVHVVLGRLPEPHRRALDATYLRDQTSAEAARRLGVPVGTVKTRVFYGLRMARSLLEGDRRPRAAA